MGKREKSPSRPTPERLKQRYKLPKSTSFKGYLVHLPYSDEFLGNVTRHEDAEQRYWFRGTPGFGKRFDTYAEAQFEAEDYVKGAVPVYLFDLGPRYLVVTL